ncbi:MAG: hypothetical protein AB1894_19220 [Chloroflexota bacterium]
MGALTTFLAALLLNLALVPLVKRLSRRLGVLSQPRQDRWHHQPTPKLGGIGICAAFAGGLLASLLFDSSWLQARWGLLAGSGLVFLIGLYDDFRPMTPPAKLVSQIVAATLVIALGYTTRFFSPRLSNEVVAQLPNILLTYLWLVGITNAINLLDNMDGLAAGISLITVCILSYFFWHSGDVGLLAIALALAGSLLGFLIYNFPPATIFMGDSGSLFLGFTLALLAIARQPQASNVFAVLGVPTLLFLLPILDTVLVTFTRLLRGQSPVKGGRDHTSHRLIAFGLNERQAVLVLYAVALACGLLAVVLESIQYWFSLVLVPLLVISLALLTGYLGGLKVVPSSVSTGRDAPLTRMMLELTFRRRILEVLLDFLLIATTYYLAFLTRYALVMDNARLDLYLRSLPVALAASYLAFYTLGVYRGVWRYVDMDDLPRYLRASIGSAILAAAGVFVIDYMHLISWPEGRAPSPLIFLLFTIFLLLGLAASRSSFRILRLIAPQPQAAVDARVIIFGAGDAGEMALRWILMNPGLRYRPVGFLDEDRFMRGRWIHGVEVLGDVQVLPELLERSTIEGIILTGEDSEISRQVVSLCHQYGCWARRLTLGFELLEP